MKSKIFKSSGLFLVLALTVCFACLPAFADSSSVEIFLNGSSLGAFSASDLENNYDLYTYSYSSYKCGNSYVYYDAYGPLLEDVLTQSLNGTGYGLNDIESIRFYTTSDAYDSGSIDFDDVISGFFYAIPGGSGEYAPAIIALAYGDVGGTLFTSNCLRDFFGQQSYSDKTAEGWVKSLDRIYLYTY